MSLTVQTNVGANAALKQLNFNTVDMNKALERLSSGFRINSAADDAAGFAIASKLQAQKGRLQVAVQNTAQAIAMVKMADSAVNEIQNMVVRMQALATQAASANTTSTERAKLEAERAKLQTEIDKIAKSTNYNGVNLLDGSGNGNSVTNNSFLVNEGATKIDAAGATANTSGVTYQVSLVEANATAAGTFGAGDIVRVTDGTTTQTITVATLPTGLNTQVLDFNNLGIKITVNAALSGQTTGAAASTGASIGTFTVTASTSAVTIQVGADNTGDNQVTVDLGKSYKAADLDSSFGSKGISTLADAQSYITYAKNALDTLTTNRADLGATQNQLGFVAASLATSVEQLGAAVSTIRDADMATEMANFTKSQILVQAGTAMLAQANQAQQNVLRLFR